MLGGVVIPSDKGEAAHSDGDVLIHAIIDALLGALSKGDIGSHFPDTDPAFQDADSMMLLKQVLSEDLPPYHIENLDTTIILQRPKLRPYIETIRKNLSEAMGLEINQVSVKAKTAEGILGELGSGDAVIAQAVVLIS
jgi:2-C-methyl-D-erythritol 2,4-cyclodiphosphate synthase